VSGQSDCQLSNPAPTAPLAPPTIIGVTGGDRSIVVEWGIPPDCETHGGLLESYVVDYRVGSHDPWSSQEAVGGVSHTLSGLMSSTKYTVRVAGRTAVGVGPYSPAESANTRKPTCI